MIELVLFMLLAGIPFFWGLGDMYVAWRFARDHRTDYTVGPLNWWFLKWMLVNNLHRLVDKHPWMRQDLSEILGERDDDQRTT